MEHMLMQGVSDFVFAGRAIFTVRNAETERRFTFRVAEPKDPKGWVRFVSVLTGSDNLSHYTYMGMMRNAHSMHLTKGSKLPEDDVRVRAFQWFVRHINHLPSQVEVYHMGACGRCGRALTVPESILTGLGPVCATAGE